MTATTLENLVTIYGERALGSKPVYPYYADWLATLENMLENLAPVWEAHGIANVDLVVTACVKHMTLFYAPDDDWTLYLTKGNAITEPKPVVWGRLWYSLLSKPPKAFVRFWMLNEPMLLQSNDTDMYVGDIWQGEADSARLFRENVMRGTLSLGSSYVYTPNIDDPPSWLPEGGKHATGYGNVEGNFEEALY